MENGLAKNRVATTSEDLAAVFQAIDADHEATAYHEAGHVVVHMMYGFKVNLVSINNEMVFDDDGTSGEVQYDRRHTSFLNRRNWRLRTRQRANEFGVAGVAGIVAEAKYLAIDWQALRDTTGKGDYERMRHLASGVAVCDGFAFSGNTINAYIGLWEQKALTLVNHEQIWPSIAALAEELFKYDFVAGKELEALLEKTVAPFLLKRCWE